MEEELMTKSFIVEVYDNGVVIRGVGVGNSFNKVFEHSNMEAALTELYRLMGGDWKVGERVSVCGEKKDCGMQMRIEG
jgi:hypothetical protein